MYKYKYTREGTYNKYQATPKLPNLLQQSVDYPRKNLSSHHKILPELQAG